MCGIAGILSAEPIDKLEEVVHVFKNALAHRGPDGEEIYLSEDKRVSLVHTRLAIQDLSDCAAQPMFSADRRFVIVFNGEIYNFKELRSSLKKEGEAFSSTSDTEVILKLYKRKGRECLNDLRGMFAFAIWDEQQKELFLARDPFGIKPLYYTVKNGQIAFASEIRALQFVGTEDSDISLAALNEFFLKGSVHEAATILSGIQLLPAASYLTWKEGEIREQKQYWSMKRQSASLLPSEAIKKTREAVLDSVRCHFVSDVPIGVFLSGGIDSTVIAMSAHLLGIKNLNSFTLRFESQSHDEGERARKTAEHLGMRHHEKLITEKEAKNLYTEYLAKIDQPTIDGFNTYCVAKFAREHGMKVILSGLGGDELFGGYASFKKVPKLFSLYQNLGAGGVFGKCLATFSKFSKGRWKRFWEGFSEKPHFYLSYLIFRGLFSRSEAQLLSHAPIEELTDPASGLLFENNAERVAFYETTVYMRDQLLRDNDVMGMACGLEIRVPFVDHVLWQAVSDIPADTRLNSKKILLDAFPEIPEWIKNKPKQGFSFPFDKWDFYEPSAQYKDWVKADAGIACQNWYQSWALSQWENFSQKR